MGRELTDREEAMLRWLIMSGHDAEQRALVTSTDRARWLAQVPDIRAGERCPCGHCPTIDLEDETGSSPTMLTSRVTLGASTPDAVLVLFIDDDRLSCLELAPVTDDLVIAEFPAIAEVSAR